MTVAPADLGTYLGVELDATRAAYLIARATDLCLSIVTPLPAGADAVVLDVAARAYSNPGNVSSQGVGPFNTSYGSAAGGLWLTRQNKATLRRLGGGSSAYSIDPIDPARVARAVEGLPFWGWDAVAYEAANAVEPVAATGAVAGIPGHFTPAGATLPADLEAVRAAWIVADPPTAWTVGQYVRLGDSSLAAWSGSLWATGPVPDNSGPRF